jgi:hypothetical protein
MTRDAPGEAEIMHACLALSDRRIAGRAPETVADLRALFVLFGQRDEWDDALYPRSLPGSTGCPIARSAAA